MTQERTLSAVGFVVGRTDEMIALEQRLDFIVPENAAARPIHLVTKPEAGAFLESLPPGGSGFLRDQAFGESAGKLFLLPGQNEIAGAVLVIDPEDAYACGLLAGSLPAGTWRFAQAPEPRHVLAYALGAYRTKPEPREPAKLALPDGHQATLALAETIFIVRDLINLPPNLLGPDELADIAQQIARAGGADATRTSGAELARAYPTVAAVGRGSERAAELVQFHWQGRGATTGAPLIALCGKGVVFDTGGYDLKSSAGMRYMKKDMGGAALALGLARLIMNADLPVKLSVWIGCVENSVSGSAMRPSDILTTRSGKTVEIGNTDAEGRLVLCDLIDAACEENPALLIDFATLTGAARVALGPDLPALFCNNEEIASHFLQAGAQAQDPAWRLPLWTGYRDWLKSPVADLGNASSKPMAGAITAALFLQSFVKADTAWLHFDSYCWNDQSRPGRPEGGEATGLHGIWHALRTWTSAQKSFD